ncbi:organic anion transporter 3-like [Amblyomma americanum]
MPPAGGARERVCSPLSPLSFVLSTATATAFTTSCNRVQSPGLAPYGHGSFQRRTLLFGIAALMVLQCHSHALVLIAGPVDHWCKPPAEFSNLSAHGWKHIGIPWDERGHHSRCRMYVQPFIPGSNSTSDQQATVPCTAWDYNPKDAMLTARSSWNLVCHREWLLAVGDAVYMSGAVFLVPVAGYLADTVGRQPVIAAAMLSLVGNSIGSCCSDSYPVYLTTRFVCSACASTVFVVTIILLYEVTSLRHRALYICLTVSAGVLLTDVFIFVLDVLRLPWFLLHVVILSPTFLLLSALCFVYESPLWLLTHSRLQKAEALMMRAATINGVEPGQAQESVQKVLSELTKRRRPEERITPATLIVPGVVRSRAGIVFTTTFAIVLAFYTTSWERTERDSPVMKILFICLSVPSYAAMYLALNTVGRKQFLVFMLPLLGGICCLCAVAVNFIVPGFTKMILVVARDCAVVAMQANYLCIAELFPTGVRCAVMCAAYAFGRVGAVLSSILRLLPQHGREDLAFAIVASAVFFSLVLALHLPETSYGRHASPTMDEKKDVLFLIQQAPQ